MNERLQILEERYNQTRSLLNELEGEILVEKALQKIINERTEVRFKNNLIEDATMFTYVDGSCRIAFKINGVLIDLYVNSENPMLARKDFAQKIIAEKIFEIFIKTIIG